MVKIMNGRDSYDYEWEAHLPDGTFVSTLVSAKPYRGPDGEIHGIVETFADITERKKAESALIESRTRLRQALQNSQDIMYRFNIPENKYEYISNALQEITGYSSAEMMKLMELSLIHI